MTHINEKTTFTYTVFPLMSTGPQISDAPLTPKSKYVAPSSKHLPPISVAPQNAGFVRNLDII